MYDTYVNRSSWLKQAQDPHSCNLVMLEDRLRKPDLLAAQCCCTGLVLLMAVIHAGAHAAEYGLGILPNIPIG